MATGTGNLPNPAMSFSPFAILTAEEVNNLVENIESLASGSGIGDGSVFAAALGINASTGNDGWISTADTWTYASASTFTVAGDQTTKYTKGTRLKWTQTTVKYGVVASSTYSAPNTTVTILVNTDYTIANAAISANYYSYSANPQGYPTLFKYTGVASAASGTPTTTTVACKFAAIGNIITIIGTIAITNKGTASAEMRISTPVAAVSPSEGSSREYATAGYLGCSHIDQNQTLFNLMKYDQTTFWVNGYNIAYSLSYQF